MITRFSAFSKNAPARRTRALVLLTAILVSASNGAELARVQAQPDANDGTISLQPGWNSIQAGLPAGKAYRLVSMAFIGSSSNDAADDGEIYAAIDSPTPPTDKRGVGPEDGIYRYAQRRWTRIAPPVNRYAVRPILAAAGRVYTVDHSGTRLYRLHKNPRLSREWEDLGAVRITPEGNQAAKQKDAPACRKFQLARAVGGRIYCPGGKHEGRLFVYDIAAKRWSEPIPQALPKAPQGIGGLAVTNRGEVFVSLRNQRADVAPAPKQNALPRTAIYRANFEKRRWEAAPFGVSPKDPDYKRYLSDYMNATGNKPGPAKILGSDGERVFASTQQGLFVYDANFKANANSKTPWSPRLYQWYKGGGFATGGRFFSTYAGKDLKRWLTDDRFQSIPEILKAPCANRSPVYSPDGATLFASAYVTKASRDKKGRLKCGKQIVYNAGLVRYRVDARTPTESLNLEPRVASYLPAGARVAGTVVTTNGDAYIAATDPTSKTSTMFRLRAGAREAQRLYEINQRSGVSGGVQQFAVAPKAEYFVIGGSGGVAVIDPVNGKPEWRTDSPSAGGVSRVAIANDGSVVALSGKTIAVYSRTGREIARTTLKRSYVTDVEISSETGLVYLVGFDNKRNRNPVQVAYLELRQLKTLEYKRRVWGYAAKDVARDMADTRLYRVAIGRNGQLYVLGESAGGNTIFRWNGKDLKTSKLVKSDLYNDPWSLKAAHILYYAQLDPRSGDVLRGQFAIPRLVSKKNLGNSFRAKDGGLAVDEAGNVYLAGASACCIPNGRLLKVAGQTPGARYAGGAALLIVSPDFRTRRLWTTFGGGALQSVHARNIDGEIRFLVGGAPHKDPAKRARHPLVTTNRTQPGDGSPPAYYAAARLD